MLKTDQSITSLITELFNSKIEIESRLQIALFFLFYRNFQPRHTPPTPSIPQP